jgi:hypothetical protein
MKKNTQADFHQALIRKINSDSSRSEPQIWVREIAIMRSLSGAVGSEVRRVRLHRGLNILWAPPEDSTKDVEMYQDGLSGHASGKTLFCRLLRYLLGEENYGGNVMQEAVKDEFGELWLLGEVFVAGQLWLAVRPMTPNLHRFAVKDCTIDQFLRGQPTHEDFGDYLKAIEKAACGSLAGRAEVNELFGWRFLLPWLTRDQECRFAALTEWRSTLSEAERPQTSNTEQQLLIRAVLGILEVKEQRLKLEQEEVEGLLKEATESLPEAERQWRRDQGHLQAQLTRVNIEAKEDDKLSELEKRVVKYREGINEAIRIENDDPVLKAAHSAWQGKRDEKSRLAGQIELLKKNVTDEEGKWREVLSKRQRLLDMGVKNPARAEDGFCTRTLADAVKRGCVKLPPGSTLESELELGEIQAESDILRVMVEAKKADLARTQSSMERVEADIQRTSKAYEKEGQRVSRDTEGLRKKWQDADVALDRLDVAKESSAALKGLQKQVADNAKLKEELKKKLEGMREAHTDGERYISGLFADVVRAVMGCQVSAQATLTDRGIQLKADRNGDLYGAALETIKTLAFDIAAMVASVEGKGHHPRFLIHDGPREADMARVIYERFFLYARKIEESINSSREPNFQYIITTTTPPPEGMQYGSKWLLDPVLDSSKPELRLLGVDL